MAREVLTFAGQAIGYSYGGPVGAVVGGLIGSALGNAIDPLDPVFGPRLEDRRIQISSFGVPVGLLFGTTRTAGNVVWAADLEEVTTEEGGKGGGPTAVSYSYFATFAVLLSANPVRAIRRIWADTVLIYDAASQIDNPQATANVDFVLYRGDETQLPDPTMEAALGVGNVPAYRGYAYVVFNRLPVSQFGNRIPSMTFEVVGSGAFSGAFEPRPMGSGHTADWDHMVFRADGALLLLDKTGDQTVKLAVADAATGAIQVSADVALETAPVSTSINDVVYVPPTNELWVLGYSSDYYTKVWRIDAETLTLVEAKPIDYIFGPSTTPGNFGAVGYFDGYAQAVNVYRTSQFTENSFRQYDLTGALVGQPVDAPVWFPSAFVGGGEHCAVMVGLNLAAAVRNVGTETTTWVGDTLYTTKTGQGEVLATQAIGSFAQVAFDHTRGRYLLIDQQEKLWWVDDSETPSFTYVRTVAGSSTAGITAEFIYAEGLDAFIYLRNGGTLWAFDGATADSLLEGVAMPSSAPQSQTLRASPNDPSAVLVSGGGTGDLRLYEKVLRGTTVGGTVAELCRASGYSSQDIDVSELTQRLRGFRVMQVAPARQAIEQLATVFFFDGCEQDDSLVFKRRGRPSSASFALADCVVAQADEQPLQSARAQESSLPRRLTLTAPDPATDYQPGAQQAQRQTVQAGSDEQISVDVVLSVDEARRTADALLFDRWQSRTTAEVKLTLAALRLTAGDVIDLAARRYRVKQRTVEDFTVGLDLVADDDDVVSQVSTGAAGSFPGQSVRQVVATNALLLDVALLRDADDEPGAYWAARGIAPHWRGAVLYGSSDNGVSWTNLGTMPTPGSALGVATTALGAWTGGNVFDEANRLTVRFANGAPSSVSRAQVLAGMNAAAVRSGGSWEVLQYRSAVLNEDGTYTLSGLLRGRRGTEHAVAGHAVGDDVVLLSASLLRNLLLDTGAIGSSRQYRAVSVGSTLQATSAQPFTVTGERLKPWAPVDLRAARPAVGGDLSLSWKRRTRLARRFAGSGGINVPLGEAGQVYDVEIWDAGYTTLKRTFAAVPAPAVTYTAAAQISDFGAPQSQVYVRIYQISARVGRGYPLEAFA